MKRNRDQKHQNRGVAFMITVLGMLGLLLAFQSWGKEVTTLKMKDDTVARVAVSTRGTVLNFPLKPSQVILIRNGSFGVQYVENDLAISPLYVGARSNLYVYVMGRRFNFDLIATGSEGSAVILVRDAIEPQKPKENTNGRRKPTGSKTR
jgi:hypothetical protein